MNTVSTKLEFAYGHRLRKHDGKCKNLHGHNAIVEVTLAETRPAIASGMILDFSIMRTLLRGWLDVNWDHACIIAKDDTELGELLMSLPDQKIYMLPAEPTAENMAAHLFYVILPDLFRNRDVKIQSVKFYETPFCYTEISV